MTILPVVNFVPTLKVVSASQNILNEVRESISKKQYSHAIAVLENLLVNDKENLQAIFLLGISYKLSHDFNKAIIYFQQSFEVPSSVGDPWLQLSECHYHLGHFKETEKYLQEALKNGPNNPLVIHRLAFLYQQSGMHKQSCTYYQQLTKYPKFKVEAHFQLALQLQMLLLMDKAIEQYTKLLELQPDHVDGWYALGTAHSYKQSFELAIDCFEKALALNANHPQSNMELAIAKAAICDWSNREKEQNQFIASLKSIVGEGRIDLSKAVMQINYFDVSPALSLEAAKALSKQVASSVQHIKLPPNESYNHSKIRVGYISPDFRSHAVGRLIYDIFRHHNKEVYEVYTYGLIHIEDDPIQHKIIQGSDHYVNCHELNEVEIAQQIRKDEIDVLIDLGGYTTYTKPKVMALQPAPIQMHYLGNPSSMGASFTPYMLADRSWIPEDNEPYFSEKMVHVDHAWISSPIPENIPELSKQELGLPDGTFIFGSFNLPQKLDPVTFKCWMQILEKTDNSVLWLYAPLRIQQENIRRQLNHAGIDLQRLYFAEHASYEKYLAQLSLVDVFLDNFQYGAGSTAVNALMMGTPVLTFAGQRMVSRLSRAVNEAAGLIEWNCDTEQAYLDKAIYWYQNHEKLVKEKNQLKENIQSSALCRVDIFVSQLENEIQQLVHQ